MLGAHSEYENINNSKNFAPYAASYNPELCTSSCAEVFVIHKSYATDLTIDDLCSGNQIKFVEFHYICTKFMQFAFTTGPFLSIWAAKCTICPQLEVHSSELYTLAQGAKFSEFFIFPNSQCVPCKSEKKINSGTP